MSAAIARLKDLEEFLRRSRNTDGGWGYQTAKASRLEPTCWALLALGETAGPKILTEWPSVDGLLLERHGGTPNYAFHAEALLVLRALGVEHVAGNRSLLAGLGRVKGAVIKGAKVNRQDNELEGWSWIAETFSWVEPTAWCLLALKQWARSPGAVVGAARIQTGERLLIDRACARGGWNYGNSNMLGQELKAFVPTTALALLALKDRPSLPEVARSIDFLEREATQERSGTALSLALLALRAFDRPVSAVRDALIAQLPTTVSFGKHVAAAMSLYALNEEDGHAAVVL